MSLRKVINKLQKEVQCLKCTIAEGGGGSGPSDGVLSVTGDGVGGTAKHVILTFPKDLNEFTNTSVNPFVRESEIPAPIDLSTGLEAIDEGNGIGRRLKGRNPDHYGPIGKEAIDLGFNNAPPSSTVPGATAEYSTISGGFRSAANGEASTVGGGMYHRSTGTRSTIAGGYQNQANGLESTVGGGRGNNASGIASTIGGGSLNAASGNNSTIAGGYFSKAKGLYSAVAGGVENVAETFGEFLGGIYATIKAGSATTWIGTDRIFGVGNGINQYNPSDAFNVYKNGLAELPSVTNDLIDAADGKAIPTKEWVNSKNPIIIVITPLDEPLTTGDVEYTFTAPYNFTLANYWISAQVAPIGSGITVRLKVNGTYIDSSGTTIPTGIYNSLTALPTISIPNIIKGDRITAEITAVGSTYEGEGLTLYLES